MWISRHLSAVIKSLKIPHDRILDVGCGSGLNMLFIDNTFGNTYGYDISDGSEWSLKALRNLQEGKPNINWGERLKIISSNEKIPYEDGYFDVIYSSQVLEHVKDIIFFKSETLRVLKKGGIAIHIFPVKEIILEGHIKMPYAHRIKNKFYINLMNRIGVGRKSRGASEWIKFFDENTRYRSMDEIKIIFPGCTFQYTSNALLQRFFRIDSYKIPLKFSRLFKYLLPVTMIIKKD